MGEVGGVVDREGAVRGGGKSTSSDKKVMGTSPDNMSHNTSSLVCGGAVVVMLVTVVAVGVVVVVGAVVEVGAVVQVGVVVGEVDLAGAVVGGGRVGKSSLVNKGLETFLGPFLGPFLGLIL